MGVLLPYLSIYDLFLSASICIALILLLLLLFGKKIHVRVSRIRQMHVCSSFFTSITELISDEEKDRFIRRPEKSPVLGDIHDNELLLSTHYALYGSIQT